MNERIIAEANMRCKSEDTIIHVGDFVTRGFAKGVEGLRLKWDDYAKLVQSNLVLMEGNHDPQNKTKTIGRHLICPVSHFRVFVSHYPTDSDTYDPLLIDWVHRTCHFAICGHVHEKWKFKWVTEMGMVSPFLNINVGVDQHNFRPVSDDEIVNMYLQEKRKKEGKQNGSIPDGKSNPGII